MSVWRADSLYLYPAKLNNGLHRGKQGLDSVYDGDTVSNMILDLGFNRYMVTSVRLLGIDTPEIRTKSKIEKIKGYQARDMLRLLIADKEMIFESVSRKGTGKYGRALGILWVNTGVKLDDEGNILEKIWENVTDKLIECGLAVPYDGGTKLKNWRE